MDIQSTIFSGLQDIITVLIGVLVTYAVAFIKQHFSARQIATATWIATDSVNFATQVAKRLGITRDSLKYLSALTKAKELASKAGLKFTDSQWETLLESAYKKGKDKIQPLQTVAGTAYTEDDVINMVKAELSKVAPNIPVDTIVNLIQQELGKLSVSVNVTPTTQIATPVTTVDTPAVSVDVADPAV